VTKDASSLSKKHMTFATSSAVPVRPSNVSSPNIFWFHNPFISPFRTIAVSIGPLACQNIRNGLIPNETYGRTAFMRTPSHPTSPAADSVRPMTPNLLVAYAAFPGIPKRPDVLETFTMEPPGLVIFESCARMQLRTPPKFIPNVKSQLFCT